MHRAKTDRARADRRRGTLWAATLLLAACGDTAALRPEPNELLPSQPQPEIAPEWVVNGLSDAHPDAQWLQAVGAAEIGASVQDARERAEFKARGALVRNLSSTVRSVTESHELFQANDTQSRLQVSLDQTVQVVGEGTLEGARPIGFFIDDKAKTAHCLLVLERAPAAREIARRIEQKEADAAAQLARARSAAPGAALLGLCEAYDHVLAARVLRVSYSVLARGPLPHQDRVGNDVLASLRALTSQLGLHIEAGQGQRSRVGAELPAHLVFALRDASGKGIDGVPLSFTLRGQAKAELGAPVQTTAGGGLASLAVRAIGSSGERSNQIACQIECLASRSLPGPSVIAEYLLPTAADTRIVVHTTATAHGEASDPAALHARVVAALAAAGFVVVPAAAIASKMAGADLAQGPIPELCQRLRGDVDYVVRVAGAAQEAPARRDRIGARATAVVLVIDVATGQVDQFLSDPADATGDTHALAAAASLERLGSVLGAVVQVRVRARAGV